MSTPREQDNARPGFKAKRLRWSRGRAKLDVDDPRVGSDSLHTVAITLVAIAIAGAAFAAIVAIVVALA